MLGIKKMSAGESKKRGTKHWNSENVKKENRETSGIKKNVSQRI